MKPGSKLSKIIPISDAEYDFEVWLRSPAVKNKANKELFAVLSDYFNISKSKITIIKGMKSKKKMISLELEI